MSNSSNNSPKLALGPEPKRVTRQATVAWKTNIITIGGDAPVRVQSMTNTDTADAIATAIQVKELARAGSEMVRITVDTPAAAATPRAGSATAVRSARACGSRARRARS